MSSKKLVVYLDQNFISDLAKLSTEKKRKVAPQLEKIFLLLKQGVKDEKLIVPDSDIQKIETSFLDESSISAEQVNSILKYLGQVSIKDAESIQQIQFLNHLFEDSGQNELINIEESVFTDNPDKRIENFDICVNLGNDYWKSRAIDKERFISDVELLKSKKLTPDEFYNQILEQVRESFTGYVQGPLFKPFLISYKIDLQTVIDFIQSDSFEKTPSVFLFYKLWGYALSDTGRVADHDHDYYDIQMLASYLPYFDIIATDNYWKTVVEQRLTNVIDLNVSVFSLKRSSLNDFVETLKKELSAKKPANESLFSIVGTTSNGKYPVSFINKLDLARNKFLKTGKNWNKTCYVEIYLSYIEKRDVPLPPEEEVLKHGLSSLDEEQASEVFSFGSNFKKLYLNDKTLEEVIMTIPIHLRGKAVAIVDTDSKFDEDLVQGDSYLLYDIEEAISKKSKYTERYKIRIVYT